MGERVLQSLPRRTGQKTCKRRGEAIAQLLVFDGTIRPNAAWGSQLEQNPQASGAEPSKSS